jgi:ABC-type nitrate/sulfonate/bicarbonate transport system, permease component
MGFLLIVVVLLVAWEAAKLLAGDPWRYTDVLGGRSFFWDPPFRWKPVNDLNLPHIWTILGSFWQLDARGSMYVTSLIGSAWFTIRESLLGFFMGAGIGLGLAIVLIHVKVLERGLVPLLVASQTVPIIAIAPVVVVGLRAGWFGVAIVATYLTFFPVTIAAIRGMRSADPRAFELMRSYAAGRRTILRKLRLPASPPYLFTAFKIAATSSVVGAIVGEFPAGIRDGLGGALLQAMQYYSFSPEDLWAAIAACAGVGILAFLLVVGAERLALRNYRPIEG